MCQVLDHLMWPVATLGSRAYRAEPPVNPEITSCCCCSVAQLCLTLCDPMDCSTPGFLVLHHLLKLAQTHVHWVGDAILLLLLLLLSCFSRVWLCATPQTAAQQVPPCLGFSRQELWSGFPFPYLMFHKFSRYVEAHISWKKGTINRIESRSFLKLLDSLQSSISLTTQTLGRKLSPWSISPFPLFQTLLLNLFLQWAV